MKWISVKDRLPEVGQEFLATIGPDDYEIDHYVRSGPKTYFNCNTSNIQRDDFLKIINFWMPKPPFQHLNDADPVKSAPNLIKTLDKLGL